MYTKTTTNTRNYCSEKSCVVSYQTNQTLLYSFSRLDEMPKHALTQANVSMNDFIVDTESGSVEATKAGQAFLEEKAGAENCAEALNILTFHKELYSLQEMNTPDIPVR